MYQTEGFSKLLFRDSVKRGRLLYHEVSQGISGKGLFKMAGLERKVFTPE